MSHLVMRKVRSISLRLFHLYHTPKNVLPPVAARFLSPIGHLPLQPKLNHMYKHRERGILWWSVGPGTLDTSHKRVVRSWCARRVRTAFRAALREKGYDYEGRKVELDSDGNIVARTKKLRGTAELKVQREVMHAENARLLQEARRCVRYLESEPATTFNGPNGKS